MQRRCAGLRHMLACEGVEGSTVRTASVCVMCVC